MLRIFNMSILTTYSHISHTKKKDRLSFPCSKKSTDEYISIFRFSNRFWPPYWRKEEAREVFTQARRQDSVTGGAETNFGGHEKFNYVNWRGAREICPSLDQMNKVKTKNSEGFSGCNQKLKRFSGRRQVISKKKGLHWNSKWFSGRNQKFKRFFRPKLGDLPPPKKGLHPKSIVKSGVSPQKLRKYRSQTPIWASICTPVAPSLLVSSWPPVAPGLYSR